MKLKNMKFIDIFAGIGGFRFAFESFGCKCVFSSEMDKFCQKSYDMNFGEIPTGDITKIDEREIPEFDILCAGFPCQPFSVSGKRRGFEDTRGTLFFDVSRIIAYHKPKLVFLENVKNLRAHNDGATFEVISNTLNELGYNVYDKVMNAKNFNLPQNRERIAIICVRKDIDSGKFDFPSSLTKFTTISDIKEQEEATIQYVINRKDIHIDEEKLSKAIAGGKINKPLQIGVIGKGGQGNRIYHENGIGITLTAGTGGVGGKTGAFFIDGRVRTLSPREASRLQGFPQNFKIIDSKCQSLKQFGNSVPINVLKEIIKKIEETI